MPLSPSEKQKRYRDRPRGSSVTTVTRPWEDVTLSLVARMTAGKDEADRTHRPVVVSAARGLVAQPAERWLTGGVPSLSV